MKDGDISTTSIDLSHHIQRQIIMRLRQDGEQPYQALKPDGVEGNAFNYHLRSLKKAGFLDSDGEKYSLTPKGFLVSDGFSSPVARLMMRPYAHMGIVVTSGDKIMVYRATRQPLNGIYVFPTGKMRYGDDLKTSLARELERRGITDNYHGEFLCQTNVLYTKQGDVVTHRPGVLWHVEYTGELTSTTTENGISEWYPIAEVATLQPISPEVTEALERIHSKSHDPIELKWEIG
jgi:ADP-ribose pyrophosphatase YjhB (NUDIX family)